MSTRQVEERIAAVAERQHGVVTFGQMRDAGLSAGAVERRIRSGRLRALHRGVYLTLPYGLPHTREMAAVIACGQAAVLSHSSAVTVWGLGPGVCNGDVDVSTTEHRANRSGIRLHRVRRLGADERTVKDGIPITTPARTIMDVAATVGGRELEGIVARAERERLVAPEQLVRLLRRSRGRAGAGALSRVLALPEGAAFTRSEAEVELLALIRRAGLPAPRCNARFGAYEIDFLWPSSRLAVEVDGYAHHSTRPRFEGDRRRDARLIGEGLTVLRLTWRQIMEEPLTTMVQLAQALARGSVEPLTVASTVR